MCALYDASNFLELSASLYALLLRSGIANLAAQLLAVHGLLSWDQFNRRSS